MSRLAPYGAFFWLTAATMAAGQVDTISRDGLLVSWEIRESPAAATVRQLADDSGQENNGLVLGDVGEETGPARQWQ